MSDDKDPQRISDAADNCEVLRARLAKYEDAEGLPVGLTHDQAELVGLVRDLALRSGKHARPLMHAAALGLESQAREIERLKRAAQTNWNKFAEDVKDQPKTAAQDECDLPPVGWICTRQRGHSGPCAAVECVDHDTAYDEGPNSDGYVCIKCGAALSAPSHGEQVRAPDGEPDWPEYHHGGMGCGLEDRGITDRYQAMQHGWEDAFERCVIAFNNWLAAAPSAGSQEQGE